ncbi:MAG: DUF2950 domain-containing protein [Alsobacter sp.]
MLLLLGSLALPGQADAQQVFATPEAAAEAVVKAARGADAGALATIFGPGSKELLSSGDAEEDQRRREAFVTAAQEGVAFESPAPDRRTLVLGAAAWPFPVPLVKRGEGWTFDAEAGREELINRTIGFNELSAIAACKAYVEAQREYYRQNPDGDEIQEYAQRILSRPGHHDGLYWPPESQADRSPLDGRIEGDLSARAARAGQGPEPYRGYHFRILKAQGEAAPGGAYSYLVKGRMLIGFALVAYPAEWGRTGVMTFICNQQDRVFQKNLGPRTADIARAMTRYDPDRSWSVAE